MLENTPVESCEKPKSWKADTLIPKVNFRPIARRVLVYPLPPQTHANGIEIPVQFQRPDKGVVVAIAADVEEGHIQVGDVVALPDHGGKPITLEDVKFILYPFCNIPSKILP
jgi:co-chaperonin GroES (HSP10)